jgi:hypothetical protein
VPEGRLIFPDLTVIENIRVAERRPAKTWSIGRLLELFPALRARAGNNNDGARHYGAHPAELGTRLACLADPVATEHGDDRAGRDLNVHALQDMAGAVVRASRRRDGVLRLAVIAGAQLRRFLIVAGIRHPQRLQLTAT